MRRATRSTPKEASPSLQGKGAGGLGSRLPNDPPGQEVLNLGGRVAQLGQDLGGVLAERRRDVAGGAGTGGGVEQGADLLDRPKVRMPVADGVTVEGGVGVG